MWKLLLVILAVVLLLSNEPFDAVNAYKFGVVTENQINTPVDTSKLSVAPEFDPSGVVPINDSGYYFSWGDSLPEGTPFQYQKRDNPRAIVISQQN